MSSPRRTDVAIVGMACRFPGATDPEGFWCNLRDGVESITFFSDEELEASGVAASLRRDPLYVPARGFVPGALSFDAPFFGFSPSEAELTDPQHRLFLEVCWEALERAACDPARTEGLIGVIAGCSPNAYLLNHLARTTDQIEPVTSVPLMVHNDKDYLASRVAYELDLHGPALTVQAACSTSLAAVHLAVQSLLDHESDVMLAGGVSLHFPRRAGYRYQEGQVSSPDGHCRPFDAAANGTVAGEGAGAVVLKRFADARAAGDPIVALIRGSAVNNDGGGKMSFTAPTIRGQAEVVAMALEVAGVDPASIGYVEAHGTATRLGDPIEVAALCHAYRSAAGGRCWLGSVKSNIGHLDAAAGVAGLIKAALALERRQIPPTLHFRRPSPEIDFASGPFRVNSTLRDWPGPGPRRAGVSSFGMGGANVHAILEEAPPRDPPPPSPRRWHLLPLSARTPSALATARRRLARSLQERPGLELSDVAYTLWVGRRAFAHRAAVLADDLPGAVDGLAGDPPPPVPRGLADEGVVFLFPGQGIGPARLSADLLGACPALGETIERAAAVLESRLGIDPRPLLVADPTSGDDGEAPADQRLAQPLLFTLELALARQWRAWGVRPAAMLGHSLGEIVAACLAGVFELEAAVELVASRAELAEGLPPGAMLAVLQEAERLREKLPEELDVAAVNAPDVVVVSGSEDAVARFAAELRDDGIASRRLATSRPFHSRWVEPILAELHRAVERADPRPPEAAVVSSVTGTWMGGEAGDPAYWTRHLRRPVRFSDGVATLLEGDHRAFLEVGPGSALGSLVRRRLPDGDGSLVLASSERGGTIDLRSLLGAARRLWEAGCDLDPDGLFAGGTRAKVALPTYPFERRRYLAPVAGDRSSPELGKRARADFPEWFAVPVWRRLPDGPPPGREAASSLVFVDGGGWGEGLVAALRSAGERVVEARKGSAYRRIDGATWELEPGELEGYRRLFDSLRRDGGLPGRVIHLWSLDAGRGCGAGDALDVGLQEGFFSLLRLGQVAARVTGSGADSKRLRVEVVCAELAEVVGGEAARPLAAALLGPCRTIPAEHAGIECRLHDLPALPPGDGGGSVVERLLDGLLDEMSRPASHPWVAYRGRYRWVQEWSRMEAPATGRRGGVRVREGGVYLITGGLGGIGRTLAAHLARTAGARLSLTGRSPMPSPDELAALRRGELGDAPAGWRRIAELEEGGAEVLAIQADVTDRRQMAEVIDRTMARWGRIDGVVHAAGRAGGRLIELETEEEAAAVLAPKLRGTVVLHEVLAAADPEFVLLCSSVASSLAQVGQVDYCAASAFLDAWAHTVRCREGANWISVDWDAWSEVGMAVETELPRELQRLRDREVEQGIRPAEGWRAFAEVLASGLGQVAVSPRWHRLLPGGLFAGGPSGRDRGEGAASDRRPAASAFRRDAATAEGERHPRPVLSTDYVEPGDELEREVAAVFQEVLGLDRVGAIDDFIELGGHSLLADQVVQRIADRSGVQLSIGELFSAGTVRGVAERLSERSPPPLDG